MFSEYKGFSQVEPRSLSLKTKLHEYQTRAARFFFFFGQEWLDTWWTTEPVQKSHLYLYMALRFHFPNHMEIYFQFQISA